MAKYRVLILGKLPPPYFGPAIATEIILNSSLQFEFELKHFDTRINNTIDAIGEKSVRKFVFMLKKYFEYFNQIKKIKPDLILVPISQSTMGFIKDSIYLHLGIKTGSKVLIHLRGSNLLNWLNKSTSLTRWYFRSSLKKTSGAIVLGENLRYLVSDFFPLHKIHVVPNGGNFVFPNAEKIQDGFKILYFSNLLQSKGIEDVIDAALILKQRNITSISFVLAGAWLDDKLKSECLNRIKSQDLQVKVFPQSSGDLKKKFFCEADIFLFPPREPEGHPWVIVEAMAAGLPIITTNQGAISESVQNGKNGFIVNINQPKEIAEKIEFLQSHHEILKEMGKESRLLYEQKFTEEIMIKNLKIAFEKTLGL
jgi:glycosyltransferase involved in cell wall biosynthesis